MPTTCNNADYPFVSANFKSTTSFCSALGQFTKSKRNDGQREYTVMPLARYQHLWKQKRSIWKRNPHNTTSIFVQGRWGGWEFEGGGGGGEGDVSQKNAKYQKCFWFLFCSCNWKQKKGSAKGLGVSKGYLRNYSHPYVLCSHQLHHIYTKRIHLLNNQTVVCLKVLLWLSSWCKEGGIIIEFVPRPLLNC